MKKGVNKIENQGENLYKIATKVLNERFLWKNRPTLGQITSGTKCDRDKPIFLQIERVNKFELGIKMDPMG